MQQGITETIHCIAVYSSCFYGMSDLVLMDRRPSDEIFDPASPRTGSVSLYDCYKGSRFIPDKTPGTKVVVLVGQGALGAGDEVLEVAEKLDAQSLRPF